MRLSGPAEWVLWGGFAIVAFGMVGGAFLTGRRRRRRTYWLCWLAGGLVMTGAAATSDAGLGVLIAGFCAVMSVTIAVLKSPYLKIGGRIIAVSRDDRRPDDVADAPSDDLGQTEVRYARRAGRR